MLCGGEVGQAFIHLAHSRHSERMMVERHKIDSWTIRSKSYLHEIDQFDHLAVKAGPSRLKSKALKVS